MATQGRPGYSGMVNDRLDLDAVKDVAKRTVTRWRDAILSHTGWKANRWAEEAGVDPTPITRTMGPKCSSTAKIETLHLLAIAANVPSVLDFLNSQSVGPTERVPSVEQLVAMLDSAMQELPPGVRFSDYPSAVAASLREQLVRFQEGDVRPDLSGSASLHVEGVKSLFPTN